MHSGQNIGKVFSPFLAGIEEPFTVYPIAFGRESVTIDETSIVL